MQKIQCAVQKIHGRRMKIVVASPRGPDMLALFVGSFAREVRKETVFGFCFSGQGASPFSHARASLTGKLFSHANRTESTANAAARSEKHGRWITETNKPACSKRRPQSTASNVVWSARARAEGSDWLRCPEFHQKRIRRCRSGNDVQARQHNSAKGLLSPRHQLTEWE